MTDEEILEASIRILHRHPDLAELLEHKEVLINEMRALADALTVGPPGRRPLPLRRALKPPNARRRLQAK
jgi:hypothetical protein